MVFADNAGLMKNSRKFLFFDILLAQSSFYCALCND